MTPDFCDRVVTASRNVSQRRPLTLRYVTDRLSQMLPVRINWAVMTMAVVFMVGMVVGFETYTYTFSDTMDVSELMEI